MDNYVKLFKTLKNAYGNYSRDISFSFLSMYLVFLITELCGDDSSGGDVCNSKSNEINFMESLTYTRIFAQRVLLLAFLGCLLFCIISGYYESYLKSISSEKYVDYKNKEKDKGNIVNVNLDQHPYIILAIAIVVIYFCFGLWQLQELFDEIKTDIGNFRTFAGTLAVFVFITRFLRESIMWIANQFNNSFE